MRRSLQQYHRAKQRKMGWPFQIFYHAIVAKKTRKNEGDALESLKNCREKFNIAEKRRKGWPFSLVQYVTLKMK